VSGSNAATRWKPGQSGNPGGRRKTAATIIDLARTHSADAIKTLAEICNNPEAAPAPRVAAAIALLDRGWGRPPQTTDITSNGDTVRYVIMAVPEAEDTDTWLQQYAPKRITTQS
jgi:hypothetical protein